MSVKHAQLLLLRPFFAFLWLLLRGFQAGPAFSKATCSPIHGPSRKVAQPIRK